ncbi:hypothetical protein CEXT_116021 [Caerostris extrusa]|uniref:Uncharacterized protein n=1 Tax=Caerostris extrusa TaxID=172846 RepID=A0AAV4YG65_CAEEX|nr:hypothetical protein CEXT_116021 [Caerostris extrusa]
MVLRYYLIPGLFAVVIRYERFCSEADIECEFCKVRKFRIVRIAPTAQLKHLSGLSAKMATTFETNQMTQKFSITTHANAFQPNPTKQIRVANHRGFVYFVFARFRVLRVRVSSSTSQERRRDEGDVMRIRSIFPRPHPSRCASGAFDVTTSANIVPMAHPSS